MHVVFVVVVMVIIILTIFIIIILNPRRGFLIDGLKREGYSEPCKSLMWSLCSVEMIVMAAIFSGTLRNGR